MKQFHALAAATALVTLTACSDTSPTQPTSRLEPSPAASMAKPGATTTLATAVTGTATNLLGQVGTFTGTQTVTSLATNAAGNLVANVLVTGTAVIAGVTTTISQLVTVPVTTSTSCPILNLDLGSIHLDVLGLVVDLSAVSLDIVAQSGAGNLLGNLLCAVVHLLDGGASGTAIANLLALINNLLG
jgi:hypothetical protein